MKKISLLFLALCAFLCSCNNNNNEELPTEMYLPIEEQYRPAITLFDKSDTEFYDKCRPYDDRLIVVNSVEELPNDPLGFNEAYTKIDYNRYTVLLFYKVNRWKIETHSSRFLINKMEKSYHWTAHVGVIGFYEEDGPTLQVCRFGIVVDKLPADAKVYAGTTGKIIR